MCTLCVRYMGWEVKQQLVAFFLLSDRAGPILRLYFLWLLSTMKAISRWRDHSQTKLGHAFANTLSNTAHPDVVRTYAICHGVEPLTNAFFIKFFKQVCPEGERETWAGWWQAQERQTHHSFLEKMHKSLCLCREGGRESTADLKFYSFAVRHHLYLIFPNCSDSTSLPRSRCVHRDAANSQRRSRRLQRDSVTQ